MGGGGGGSDVLPLRKGEKCFSHAVEEGGGGGGAEKVLG